MTSIILDSSPGPKLHAFIIGVGSYSYLSDGSAPEADHLPLAMGQLVAAPISALTLVNWLLKEYDGVTPIGSIEVLISATDIPEVQLNDGTKVKIADRADNAKSLRDAFSRWYKRANGVQPAQVADEARDNISLFFFCGHGFEKGDVHLLLEEFGADKNVLFENSFNFHKFYRAMKGAKPRTQLYFVDSCRSMPKAATDRDDIDGVKLLDVLLANRNEREAPILFSTLSNSTAWAPVDGSPTRFTQCLIECLRGGASDKDNGVWQITTGKLITSVKELLNDDPIKGQLCISEGDRLGEKKILRVLRKTPAVKLKISCNPKIHLEKAKFSISSAFLAANHQRAIPVDEPWELEVEAGTYVFEASTDKPEHNVREELPVSPPKTERILQYHEN